MPETPLRITEVNQLKGKFDRVTGHDVNKRQIEDFLDLCSDHYHPVTNNCRHTTERMKRLY